MKFLPMSVAAIAFLAGPVAAQVQEVSPQGVPVSVPLAPGNAVTLNFRLVGERIQQVWVDQQTFFTVNADGCLAGLEDSNSSRRNASSNSDCAAPTLLHLRRIERLDIPGVLYSQGALVTVLTDRETPYLFEVYPSPSPGALIFNVVPPPVVPDYEAIEAFRRGVARAKALGRLSSLSPLWARLEEVERALVQGRDLRYAARTAGVSIAAIEQLIRDGLSPVEIVPHEGGNHAIF